MQLTGINGKRFRKRSNGTGMLKGNGRASGINELIRFEEVSKFYRTTAGDFTALEDVDLCIKRAEFVSIVGKSGSGKTTLINLLTGIDQPTDGRIFVDGTAVHQLKEGQRAVWRGRTMGVVFQFFQLLPTLTVLENVRIPMDFSGLYSNGARDERAYYLLSLVGLVDYAHDLPAQLSGGNSRRWLSHVH
jgi:putative ABC transport system ATP-binding protein